MSISSYHSARCLVNKAWFLLDFGNYQFVYYVNIVSLISIKIERSILVERNVITSSNDLLQVKCPAITIGLLNQG